MFYVFIIFISLLFIGIPSVLYFLVPRKGILYWKQYFIARILLKSYVNKFQKQLSVFKRLKKKDLSSIDVGLIPTALEYEAENPKGKSSIHSDGIHFTGVDFDGNVIDILVKKIKKNVANVWVYFKSSAGVKYRLPGSFDSRRPYIDNEFAFYSCGLQIKCLSPLRKWRISFNGLLQKHMDTVENVEELLHFKFSFVWLAMSRVQEPNVEFSCSSLAGAFADASQNITSEDLNCFHKLLNKYEQWGQLIGTYSVNNSPEKELYLWSCRTRITDVPLWSEDTIYAKFYIYFKEGYPLKIESITVKNLILNYTSGYTVCNLGCIEPISNCHVDSFMPNEYSVMEVTFDSVSGKKSATFEVNEREMVAFTGPTAECEVVFRHVKVRMDNGDIGHGILHLEKKSPLFDLKYTYSSPSLLLKDTKLSPSGQRIIHLTDTNCTSSLISGGKGSSLALLSRLSEESHLFKVPRGFVLTTSAFEEHIAQHVEIGRSIRKLVGVLGGKVKGDLEKECYNCQEIFKTHRILDELQCEIEETLQLYSSNTQTRFSVRSSAFGEDSDDLSAAGQMLTVLGVKGIDDVIQSIIKCWSSKFSYEAVQYARQNGQLITSPMAVVVQEMVHSEVSGVLFTVDPVSGNPLFPVITANYGLGETVVSAIAEPDTFHLKRKSDDCVDIANKILGSKKTQILLNEKEGIENLSLAEDSTNICLSDEWAKKLGSIGILIEKCYCSPRDIEWAIHKDQLFLLQARPITTLHSETDFELIHDQDTPTRSEMEYWTRANTGEVFPGATSPLGISLVVGVMSVYGHRNQIIQEFLPVEKFCPYIFHVLPVTHRQVNISLLNTLYRMNEKEVTNLQKAFEVAIFGRIIGDEVLRQEGIKKYGYTPKMKKYLFFGILFFVACVVPWWIKKYSKIVKSTKFSLEKCSTVFETWRYLMRQNTLFSELCAVHGQATMLSCFTNLILITTLANGKEDWDSELFCDFASLLSSFSGVESADVPASMQELAVVIAKKFGKEFSSLPMNEAVQKLETNNESVGDSFKEFIQKHGHRCIKEFDVYSVSWGLNPETLIPILQNLVISPNILNVSTKKEKSSEEIVSSLKTPLSNTSKWFVKTILPWCRQNVRLREQTKSMVIKSVDWLRYTCNHLAKLMVEEGMLPNQKLIYFLTLEEIKDIFEMRKPGLIARAIHRQRLHLKLDKIQFPEIIKGIPKPIQNDEDIFENNSSVVIQGVPVCQGKVKGIARVITSLNETSLIQHGDILITHSTDVGWTPYFPLLSGVVTVLGGLVSHGAVIAREYGLPCIVNAKKALSAFKSGDVIILDGNKGTITKCED